MDIKEHIGCCGAYCKTCRPYIDGYCKGCKLGFNTGERDIDKAKCKIKLCCFKEKGQETCADCAEFNSCALIDGWHSQNGYKYKKYKKAIEFIRENGYAEFVALADKWKNAYGKLNGP